MLFYATGTYKYLELSNIQRNLEYIRIFNQTNPVLMVSFFMMAYISITALSIPGAIVLTLLSGAIFGVETGTILVSLASTIGATIAFLMSRYLFQESMMKKFHHTFISINEKFKESGSTYLFTLRLIPVSPFVVINILMGLTSIRLWSFIWITFVAMVPGNLVYVYAGRKIAEINSPSEILTWPIILSLTFIGLLPFVFRIIFKTFGSEHRINL